VPAEGIHLLALADTLLATPSAAAATRLPPLRAAARLGAVFVDLPYFDRFGQAVLNYVLGRQQASSRWGDVLHHRSPIELGRRLGEASVRLGAASATREEGQLLRALALGYISHAAVDTSMHPMVNRLALERTAALGAKTTANQQHQEVEKYQSVLFHEERLGFDMMGDARLTDYIHIDFAPLVRPGPLAQAVAEALRLTHGDAPTAAEFGRWTRGYGHYTRILRSPLGKTIVTAKDKRRERPALYDRLDFPARFAEAVALSRRYVEAMHSYLTDGAFDPSAQAALARIIPEGSIDPGAPGAPGAPA